MKKDLSLYKKYLKTQKPQKLASGGEAKMVGQNPFQFLNQQDGTQGLDFSRQSVASPELSKHTPSFGSKIPMGTTSDSTDPNITGANNSLVQSGQADVMAPMAGQALTSLGEVMAYDGGMISDLADSFKKAFGTPVPSPTPDPTLQEKYNKVRQQNRKNFDSPDESHFEGGISGSTHKTQYSDGGEVEPDDSDDEDSDSGPDLKALFQKYLDMSDKPMNSGGKVQHYYDGTDYVEPSDAPAKEMDKRQQVSNAFKNSTAQTSNSNPSSSDNSSDQGSIRDFLGLADGGEVQHFDDGGISVPQDPVYPDLTPEQDAANAAELAQLKANGAGQEQIQGDEQYVTAGNPVKAETVETSEKPDDKALEEEMANEDFKSEEAANDNNPEKKRELASEEDDKSDNDSEDEDSPEDSTVRQLPGMTLKASEALKENPEKSDSAAGLQVNPEIQKMIDATKGSTSSNLKAAQDSRDRNILFQKLERGGTLIGAGIAGRGGTRIDPSEALKNIAGENVNLPIQKYEEQIANQQNDPNSPMSKITRDYFKNTLHLDVPETASYSDMNKIAPYATKQQALQTAIQKVVMQQTGANSRNTNSVASANQRAKEANALKEKEGALDRANRIAAAKAGLEAKQNNNEAKAEQAMTNARSKPALAMAQRNLIYIQNMQKMFEDYGNDPNKWTPSQVAAWNTEKAKVAQGGVPTESMVHELSNPTYGSQMAGYIQKFTATPTGAGQGDFINQDRKYIDGLRDVSQNVVKGNVGDTAKSVQSGLSDGAYKNLIYRHSDALGLFNQNEEKGIKAVMAAKGLSRQDAIKALIQNGKIKDVNY